MCPSGWSGGNNAPVWEDAHQLVQRVHVGLAPEGEGPCRRARRAADGSVDACTGDSHPGSFHPPFHHPLAGEALGAVSLQHLWCRLTSEHSTLQPSGERPMRAGRSGASSLPQDWPRRRPLDPRPGTLEPPTYQGLSLARHDGVRQTARKAGERLDVKGNTMNTDKHASVSGAGGVQAPLDPKPAPPLSTSWGHRSGLPSPCPAPPPLAPHPNSVEGW